MTNIAEIDMIAIENRARAMRAAYVREAFAGFFARFRTAPAGIARA